MADLEDESTQLRQRTYVSKQFEIKWDGRIAVTSSNFSISRTYLPNIYKNTITSLFQSQQFEFKLEHLITNWMIKGYRQNNHLQGDSYLGIELNLLDVNLEGDNEVANTKHIVPFDVTSKVRLVNDGGATTASSAPQQTAFNILAGNGGSNKMVKPADVAVFFKYDEVIPKDRILKVRVSLTLGLEIPKPQVHDPALDKLAADMNQLLVSGDTWDFTITCGAEKFPVLKGILSGRSKVFKAMFNSGLAESQTNSVEIVDFEPVVVKHLLEYIYTSRFDPTKLRYEELFGLAKAAHKYQLNLLHRSCLDALLCNLNEKNAGSLAVLGYLQDADYQFKLINFSFCEAHWTQLADDEKFQNLVKVYPEAFFKPKAK